MKLYKLEAMRGFAAFYVLMHHTLPYDLYVAGFKVSRLFYFGQEAVMLFFLVSGFVINYSFQMGKNKTFPNYFSKRFLRIFSPLILVYLACYLAEAQKAGALIDPQLGALGLNILMLQDLGWAAPNTIVDGYMNNGPLWSLSYEWWFYMLFFPIATRIPHVRHQNMLVLSVAVIAAVFYVNYPFFLSRLLMYMSIWWVGVHLSNLYIKHGAISISDIFKPALALGAITLILAVDAFLFWKSGERLSPNLHPLREVRHFVFAIIFLFGAVKWQQAQWKGFDLLFKPFLILAPISYGIYITHWNLMREATYLDFIVNPVVRWFAYLAVVIVFSYLIELKFYPWVRGKWITRSKRIANAKTQTG